MRETSFSESTLLPTFLVSAERGLRVCDPSLPLLTFIHFQGPCLGQRNRPGCYAERRCHTWETEDLHGPTAWAEVHLGEGGQGAKDSGARLVDSEQPNGRRVMDAGNLEWG